LAVGGQAGHTEGALTFSQVTVPHSATYILSLYIVRNQRSGKTFTVQVNNAAPVEQKFGDFLWGQVDLPVFLQRGKNSITLRVNQTDSLRVDKIRIVRSAGEMHSSKS
jgi:hypothetical protein